MLVICVIGEALIDIIVDPTGYVRTSVVGGAPFNTARTCARLGVPTSFLGGISTDAFGSRMMDMLAADGLIYGLGHRLSQPSTVAIAQLDQDNAATYRFMFDNTAAASVTAQMALEALGACTSIHVGTLGLVLEPLADATAAVVSSAGSECMVMADPKCRPSVMDGSAAFARTLPVVLDRADVIKVSGDDLAYLYPSTEALQAAQQLQQRANAVVLFTDGSQEVRIITAGMPVTVPVPHVDVVDTVGAGDSFSGGFLAYWAHHGLDRAALADIDLLTKATAFGVKVAGITCTRPGADPPHASEIGAY